MREKLLVMEFTESFCTAEEEELIDAKFYKLKSYAKRLGLDAPHEEVAPGDDSEEGSKT